jgi:hypothetical protein
LSTPVSTASGAEGTDLRRRWLVISLATIVMQFAYWPMIASLGTRDDGATAVAQGPLAFGLAFVPFAFMALAFGSRHDNAPMATLKALGLFLLVAMPLVVIVDPMVGIVSGLTAGGTAALQRDPDLHDLRWRWIAVGVVTVYVFVLRVVAVEFALMSGAVLPFAVHGLVDQAAEAR